MHAAIRILYRPKNKKRNAFYGFDVSPRYTVKTDANGECVFPNMPVGIDIAVTADSPTKRRDHWLGTVKLSAQRDDEPKTDEIDD